MTHCLPDLGRSNLVPSKEIVERLSHFPMPPLHKHDIHDLFQRSVKFQRVWDEGLPNIYKNSHNQNRERSGCEKVYQRLRQFPNLNVRKTISESCSRKLDTFDIASTYALVFSNPAKLELLKSHVGDILLPTLGCHSLY